MSNETNPQIIGRKIGMAIARDVLADKDLSREWTGLDPQDADQIPEGVDMAQVELWAENTYEEALAAYGAAAGR